MAPPPPSLDYWRGFFSGARASIFDTIDAAICLAAADNPDGLRARRDAIAHRLYTVLNVLPPPEDAVVVAAAPAFPDRASRHDPIVAEVFSVKTALASNQQMSEEELLDLLRRLQQLKFTADAIKVTEIGKAVKHLRNYGSKQIRILVRSLIKGWQAIVSEWVSDEGAIVDRTPQSMEASCIEQEEGGLPSPPMDEAALFATPCTSIQLSEFFDEMDDDGNVRINAKEGEQQYPTNHESVKKQPPMAQQYDPVQNWRLDQSAVRQSRLRESCGWQTGQQCITEAQEKPSNAAFGPGRPHWLHSEPIGSELRPKPPQGIILNQTQRRTKPTMPNRLLGQHDENPVQAMLELAKNAKIEATKRKLEEGYQEFSNAKQERIIQMVDPQDLLKQGNRSLQPNGKARNNSAGNIRNRLGIHH
ncbi:probable mediator of RNA polymerase II transcription subunit 26a [Triticum dicoccoides]|uniref:TFIIS N-terminal domain-containing protein n=2 Tax=Triticum TaxID=4564 RepID=A0A9R0V4T7_TRITD|nr:probable mediator of RNA polymerase II transcription subunit 26a [Triticum dicoccoides]VAH14757.1 unnamed protein product [Triticum turgidum subsp. durum]